jgi:hypothetical protein
MNLLSGEGYLYLQKAVEAITGKQAHLLVEQLVLEPLVAATAVVPAKAGTHNHRR